MKWTKVAQAVHKLKVILDGASGTPSGGNPYLYANYDNNSKLRYGICGNNIQQSGTTVYFYIDNSTELDT